jgi:hypothetical protein
LRGHEVIARDHLHRDAGVLHVRIEAMASARGGSIIPTNPSNTSPLATWHVSSVWW